MQVAAAPAHSQGKWERRDLILELEEENQEGKELQGERIWNGLGWNGWKEMKSHLIPWAGTHFVSQGAPAWPWAFPGILREFHSRPSPPSGRRIPSQCLIKGDSGGWRELEEQQVQLCQELPGAAAPWENPRRNHFTGHPATRGCHNPKPWL